MTSLIYVVGFVTTVKLNFLFKKFKKRSRKGMKEIDTIHPIYSSLFLLFEKHL